VPFLFVDPAFRKQDEQETLVITTGPVLAEIRKWVDHRLAESAPGLRGKGILIFFEANNPRKMDEAERRLDKSNAQIDPWLRYKLWLEFARPLAFDYVQPPLQPGKQSVKYLDLFCMALGGAGASARSRPKEEGISPALLLHHLRCFCSMSVLKKRSADEEESFRRMRDKLVSCIQTNGLVPFVADDDGRIQEIKRRAEANRNIEISARKAWRSLHALAATDAAFRSRLDDPPSLSEGPMDIFFQMLGRCYLAACRLKRFLERLEFERVTMDSVVGAIGVTAILLSVAGHLSHMEWLDYVSSPSLVAAVCYGVTRAVVSYRRNHLGEPAVHLWTRMQRKRHAAGGQAGDNDAHRWLAATLSHCAPAQWGPVFGGDEQAGDMADFFDRIFGYSEFYYSDKIWTYRPPGADDQFSTILRSAIKSFPQALWGARYDYTMFSVVIPVPPPGPGDDIVAMPTLDKDLADIMNSTKTITNSDRTPHFLVHRSFADVPHYRWKRAAAPENEAQLLFLTLLHTAYFLENIADAGNLQNGLTRPCRILWSAPNKSLANILKFYGFERFRGGQGDERDDSTRGLWSLTIDDTTFEGHEPGKQAAQRFVDLLDKLITSRNERLSASQSAKGSAGGAGSKSITTVLTSV
jgi:hypothetical protein